MFDEILKNPAISVVLVASMGAIAYTIKDIPVKAFDFIRKKILARVVFTARVPDYESLFFVLEKWLFDRFAANHRDVHAAFDETKANRMPKIIFKSAPNIFTVRYAGKWVLIEKRRQNIEHAENFRSLFAHEYIISAIKGRDAITNLLEEAKQSYYKHLPVNAVTIKTHHTNGYYDYNSTITVKPLTKVIIDAGVKAKIINDVDEFKGGRKWYTDNAIPYKRTYCFYGPPGTGKTSLSLAIASYLDADVYVININSLADDFALQTAFQQIPSGSILLLEDVDAAFNGRQSKCKVSFSALLNCTDGAFYRDGLITCITTNHIDTLDPALLRTGRCDMKIHITYPSAEEVSYYISQFFGENMKFNLDSEIPMSDVQEICISHKNDPYGALDALYAKSLSKISV
ncbi:AAA family ATPase [Chitinophaga nivalis]|uniref:AAA family ATPase n=1 Tax=Chitinophaga nivalis TaxID=2991709 RepID=A0ABT3IIH8_9BACT|nr:AAA family ATPase [Chitinophaga nivalis]MCW3466542.1 AAA family ATPase [Chitinophaga nivalis]MCW3483767.1 AAA family ATPase [Chitinophaga nivalis]